MKKMIATLIAAVLVAATGACGSGSEAPEEAPAAGDGGDVVVVDFKYQPADLEVDAGSAVEWRNEDTILHTVTSGEVEGPTNSADGLFDGQLPEAGSTFSYTFEEPGTYTYFCSQHNVMNGTITVQ